MNTVANPLLYEIDTRAWLNELGRNYLAPGPLTLDRVPDAEFDRFVQLGFDWIWLMGVWRTGPIGREVAQTNPGWRERARELLPDFQEDDLVSSMYAVRDYEVDPRIGNDAMLRRFRRRLHDRGLRLMLDLVPNHTARDHPWVAAHPEFYIAGTEHDLLHEPACYARAATVRGSSVIAFGRDPYFPAWNDSFQLNYRHAGLREAMISTLIRLAENCDGLRCDMAMLLLPDVIQRVWGDRSLPADDSPPVDAPFWPEAIRRLRAARPETVLLAEVYWGLESRLQADGFDFTYDKGLYDHIRTGQPSAVRAHLQASLAYQGRAARFLENHDEPRAASVFAPPIHQAAAVLTYLVPGLRFFHQGQLEGRRLQPVNHLRRRAVEPDDPDTIAFYESLLALLRRESSRNGHWEMLDSRESLPGDPSFQQIFVFQWTHPRETGLRVVVNFGDTRARCQVENVWPTHPRNSPPRELWKPRSATELRVEATPSGLRLDLPPWGISVVEIEPGP